MIYNCLKNKLHSSTNLILNCMHAKKYFKNSCLSSFEAKYQSAWAAEIEQTVYPTSSGNPQN